MHAVCDAIRECIALTPTDDILGEWLRTRLHRIIPDRRGPLGSCRILGSATGNPVPQLVCRHEMQMVHKAGKVIVNSDSFS